MQAYRETDEGRAECAEVIGRLGSWKSHLKETERFKYLINADLLLPDSDKAWREPLVCTARNYTDRNARTRPK